MTRPVTFTDQFLPSGVRNPSFDPNNAPPLDAAHLHKIQDDLQTEIAVLRSQITGAPVVTDGVPIDNFRLANGGSPVFSDYEQTASRFQAVILNIWERDHLAALKEHNPHILGLGYQELIYDGDLLDTGAAFQSDGAAAISRQEAADATGWWMLNSGTPAENPFGSGGRLLRLELPEVQAVAAANMLARATEGHIAWDGIFADDYNYNIPTITTPFTDDWTWYKGALRPAAFAIYRALNARGVKFVPNFGNAGEYPWLGDTFAFMDGYLDEFWMRYGNGSWNGYWYDSFLLAQRAIRQGQAKAYLNTSGTSDTDWVAGRSGLAAALMLVDGDRQKAAYYFNGTGHINEIWMSEYDYDIGDPTGDWAWAPEGLDFDSAMIRYFERGVAVLNPGRNPGAPHGNGAVRSDIVVNLSGGPYSGSGRTGANLVSLSAGEGAILVKD